MSHLDTIVALATPQGQGGIGIIRISGTLTSKISRKLLKMLPYPRKATYLALYDYNRKNILDNIIAIFFPAPNSFTGEDVLEIHGHGGPIILDIIINNILKISLKNIRLALPGEFSERAFMNNKIDLLQAEAIADLISANSYQAAKLASNTLRGTFSKKIYKLEKQLFNLRTYIEFKIDFPEEETSFLDYTEIQKQTKNIINETQKICDNAQHGSLIQKGIKIVITGKPNSGKSSLFNALSERQSAIVSSISGTTRDTLHEYIQLNETLIHIVDTAGLQTNENLDGQTKQINEIEKIGINRAWCEIEQANHILLLIDTTTTTYNEQHQLKLKIEKHLKKNNSKTPIVIIRNKADLTKEEIKTSHINGQTIITISAKYKQGIELIKKYLNQKIKFSKYKTKNNFTAHQRHIEELQSIRQHLLQANKIINKHIYDNKKYPKNQEYDILAEELRWAHTKLNKITGQSHSKELLKKIFTKFCIGK